MRSTKKIREIFNLSQEQLAVFLGVPRSQVAQAETGRRQLSTRALLQLARLEQSLHSNIDYTVPGAAEAAETRTQKGLAAMKAHAEDCCRQAAALRLQLAQLEETHQRCTRVQLAVGHLLHHLPEEETGKKEWLWLQLRQHQVQTEMAQCTMAEKVKLMLKAEALEQEAARALAMKF
jgi:transcriptional regulator with XRE-family HTH domain